MALASTRRHVFEHISYQVKPKSIEGFKSRSVGRRDWYLHTCTYARQHAHSQDFVVIRIILPECRKQINMDFIPMEFDNGDRHRPDNDCGFSCLR